MPRKRRGSTPAPRHPALWSIAEARCSASRAPLQSEAVATMSGDAGKFTAEVLNPLVDLRTHGGRSQPFAKGHTALQLLSPIRLMSIKEAIAAIER